MYAYTAKTPDVIEDPRPDPDPWPWPWPPTNFPPDYPYDDEPYDDPIIWPPNYPIESSSYSSALICDTTTRANSPLAFTSEVYEDNLPASGLLNHFVVLWATIDGEPVNIKKSATDSFSSVVWFYITNYTGDSYGVNDSIYVDMDGDDNEKTIVLTSIVPSVLPNLVSTALSTAVIGDPLSPAAITSSVSFTGTIGAGRTPAAIDAAASSVDSSLTYAKYEITVYDNTLYATDTILRIDYPDFGTFKEYHSASEGDDTGYWGDVDSGDTFNTFIDYRNEYSRQRTVWSFKMPTTIVVQPTYVKVVFSSSRIGTLNDDDSMNLGLYVMPDIYPINFSDWDTPGEYFGRFDPPGISGTYAVTEFYLPGSLAVSSGRINLMIAFEEDVGNVEPTGYNGLYTRFGGTPILKFVF